MIDFKKFIAQQREREKEEIFGVYLYGAQAEVFLDTNKFKALFEKYNTVTRQDEFYPYRHEVKIDDYVVYCISESEVL